jgi:hypothetical protein
VLATSRTRCPRLVAGRPDSPTAALIDVGIRAAWKRANAETPVSCSAFVTAPEFSLM